jgi:hypothetical protein
LKRWQPFPFFFIRSIKLSTYKAIVGPFKSNPFNEPIAVLPINSVPKKESLERRVIVDLSFPEDKSVSQRAFLYDPLANQTLKSHKSDSHDNQLIS